MLVGSVREAHHERNATSSVKPLIPGAKSQESTDAYKAVSLRVCANSCRSATELRGQTFLLSKAPRLPLTECDRVCQCRFSIHDDRRVKNDRRHPARHYVGERSKTAKEDVRSGIERRARQVEYKGIY
jgi:hypothetical protein